MLLPLEENYPVFPAKVMPTEMVDTVR